MLTKIEINGFKSIKHASIELGRVNLFIGGNGVGKSNILEAIGILSACLDRDITASELQKKGVRLSVPTLFKSAFKNSNLRANFDLKAIIDNEISYDVSITAGETSEELQFFSERLCFKNEKIMGRSNHGVSVRGLKEEHILKDHNKTRGIWDRYSDIVDIPENLYSSIKSFSNYLIYSPQTAFLRGTDIESVPIKPIGLNGGSLPNAVNTLITNWQKIRHDKDLFSVYNRIFELVWAPGWTNSFRVRSKDPRLVSSEVKTTESTLYFIDKFMNAKRNMLSAYDSSEGTLYILFVVVLLLHPEIPKVFALDNVDNALNPGMTKKLIEAIISFTDKDQADQKIGPEQVFMTSHNPTSLDAFDIFDNDQRIFVVSRNREDGTTQIKRLSPPENSTKAEWIKKANGKNLSELWIEGKIKDALGI